MISSLAAIPRRFRSLTVAALCDLLTIAKSPSRRCGFQMQKTIGILRELIVSTRQSVAVAVNAALTMLYWQIGSRIRKDILLEKRAEYGEQIVAALARQLAQEFGRGFGGRNLARMIRFAEVFPDSQIVSALMTKLGWTHFLMIIPLKDSLQRDFYAEMCRVENWSTRTLQQKINGMLYERTALSKKPDELIRQELDALRVADQLTPDLVFKDPYLLDFLGLKDTYLKPATRSGSHRFPPA